MFEYFASDRVEFDRFHLAMTNLSAMAVSAALEAYDFSPFNVMVDVGGGHGFAICSILEKYPQMQGVLFDLEDIVPGADERIRKLGLQERCRTAFGDFFQAVPEGGDVYFRSTSCMTGLTSRLHVFCGIAAAHWIASAMEAGPVKLCF
ncbi:MAG: hypothetical protein JO319_16110 [Acidobacteriaceae bacterium]|nr:hypothetical protein [Acidobacteriaceae bacterium]